MKEIDLDILGQLSITVRNFDYSKVKESRYRISKGLVPVAVMFSLMFRG